jgi:hypothetical protein
VRELPISKPEPLLIFSSARKPMCVTREQITAMLDFIAQSLKASAPSEPC